MLGFLSVLAVFATVTIVSYGILPRAEIADLRQPSMAGVMEAAVGSWGNVFISLGLIVSVLGAYLAWTLMAAEVLFVAAKDDDMPLRAPGEQAEAPAAVLMTTVLIQVMLFVPLVSEDAFNFMLNMTSALTLDPVPAGRRLRAEARVPTGAGDRPASQPRAGVAALATLYTLFLLFAAGPSTCSSRSSSTPPAASCS